MGAGFRTISSDELMGDSFGSAVARFVALASLGLLEEVEKGVSVEGFWGLRRSLERGWLRFAIDLSTGVVGGEERRVVWLF